MKKYTSYLIISLLFTLLVNSCKKEVKNDYSNLRQSIIDDSYKAEFTLNGSNNTIPFWGYSEGSESPCTDGTRLIIKSFLYLNSNELKLGFYKKYNIYDPKEDNYKKFDNLSNKNLRALICPGLYEPVTSGEFYDEPEGITINYYDNENYQNSFRIPWHKSDKSKSEMTSYIEIKDLNFIDNCNLVFEGEYHYLDSVINISGTFKGFFYNDDDCKCPFDNGN